jgi:hypothetical protein
MGLDVKNLNLLDALGLSKFNLGAGSMGNIVLLFALGIIIVALVCAIIIVVYKRKQYFLKIPLYSSIGNRPTRIGYYKARVISIGTAGDKLWFVKKARKYLSPGTIQSAPNEFWYWVREDGEWINFSIKDLDEVSKTAGVKFIQQDMRMARLATERLLEQRLMKKNFWEKYGVMIGFVLYFLLVTVSLAIMFYLWGDIIEQTSQLLGTINNMMENSGGSSRPSGVEGLVPASIGLLLYKRRKKYGLPN